MPRPTPPALHGAKFSFQPALTTQAIAAAPKLSLSAFKLQVALVLQSVTAIWDDMTKFADAEIPFAAGDGMTFTLANAPSPASSLQLFYNGLEQHGSYELTGNVIVFSGDIGDDPDLIAWYRF